MASVTAPAMTTSTVARVSTVRVVLHGLRRGARGPLGGWVAGCAGQATAGAGIGNPPGGDTASAANDTELVPAGEVGAPDIGAPDIGAPDIGALTGAPLYTAPGEIGAGGYPGPEVGAAGPVGPEPPGPLGPPGPPGPV